MATPLKDILTTITSSTVNNWKINLIANWPNFIGDLYGRMRLEKINPDNTLLIGVYDSSWLHELYFLSPILLKTINSKLNEPHIKGIKFRYVAQQEIVYKPIQIITKKTDKPITLAPAQEYALATIQDLDLRKVLYKFLVRCHQE